MNSYLRWLVATLLLMAPTAVSAQWGMVGNHPVSVSASFDEREVAAGGEVTLTVVATVEESHHIYAMRQSVVVPGPGPIATEIILEGAEALIPISVWNEPEVTTKFDLGFERDVDVLFGSPLTFTRTFQVNPETAEGAIAVEGIFFVQACTETSCLPPVELPFSVTLNVRDAVHGAVAATPVLDELDGVVAAASDAPATDDEDELATPAPIQVVGGVENRLAGTSFPAFLLASFLFGLIALATPCVFPMIPITISFFTKSAGNSPGRAAVNALVYVLSIIAGFTLLGFGVSLLMLALGGGVESGGFAQRLASDPFVNIFFFLLYLTFALGLLGVFNFSLPAGLTNYLNREATGRTDFLGIAMKAMVFVIISFTCTAPLVGVLIVQTLSGEWTRPLFGMMAFATGFASPFFLLALAPQLLGSLPKAGEWLHVVKIVMGLVVLAAAFKFLSVADVVVRTTDMILTRELLLAIWATIAAVTAFYLFGFLRLKGDSNATDGIGVGRLLTGTTFAVAALYLAGGIFGARLHGFVDAFLPPDLTPRAPLVASPGAPQGNGIPNPAQMHWFDNVEEAKALAAELGKPLFIDFTGYSCTNCRLMERNMFPRPEIATRLDQFVRVKLFTDDRTVGAKHREFQARNFNTVSVPFYVVMDSQGNTLAVAEFTTNASDFVDFLDTGLVREVAAR